MSKIFCIGSNKTGTTSLSRALSILGYNVAPIWPVFSRDTGILEAYFANDYTKLNAIIDKYDAFKDRPWNHGDFYKYLDMQYPKSRFILTIRDTESWISSYRAFAIKIGLKNRWFYKKVSQACYGNEDFLADEISMARHYETRNDGIVQYFSGQNSRFLTIDLEDINKMEKLSNFLNKSIPLRQYPHLNRR